MFRALLAACLCVAVLAGIARTAAAEGNGLAPTPPMGWNDWYSSYCSVNAQLVEQTAQEMVNNGMKAAGYDYVNIDDCWMAPSRDASGNLVADPTRFPDGIAAVAATSTASGIKLGIYEDAGTTTCAHFPGSYGHEAQDAATFAAWGVDYVKYDRCNIPYGDFPGESEQQVQQTLYTRMSNALRATGRPIVFSMCNPDPGDDPWLWGAPISNLWRTTTDIEDNFGSMLGNFEGTVGLYRDAGPGAWNDPDLLQIGNGGSSSVEYTSEFSLWAEMAAPLIASTNIGTLTAAERAIYENPNVIAVDQDPLGQPGVPISRADGLWVMTKKMSDGSRAVVLFNSNNTAATIDTTATAVGLPGRHVYRVHNLWTNAVSETGGAIERVRAGPRRRDVHRERGVQAPRVEACAAHRAVAERRRHPARRRAVDDVVRVAHQQRCVRSQAGSALAVGVAGVAGQAARPHASGPARGRPAVHGRLPDHRARRPGRRSRCRSSAGRRRSIRDTAVTPRQRRLGELVSAPVASPLATADVTTHPASFGASGRGLAISARGVGSSTRRSGRPRPTRTRRSTDPAAPGAPRAPRSR